MPGGLDDIITKSGKKLSEVLDDEQVALLLPRASMEAFEGSYDALRATADQIATSTLRETLPEPWQELVANPITDGKKRPLSILPGFVDKNEAFTKVSFKDVHLEAKTFVRQYRFGTGSYQSTHDCVTSRLAYRRARFYSLDGEFLDDIDPMWAFWQFELEKKMALFHDWEGKKPFQSTGRAQTGRALKLAQYSLQTYSRRIGRNIRESPQALTATRYEYLHMARPENLGAPHGMTTFVANPHAPAITAHVRHGPLAMPRPEDALDLLKGPAHAKVRTTSHVGVRTVQYLRSRRRFEHHAFQLHAAKDTYHGRPIARTRRRENQKRGDNHDHYCYWCESCGWVFRANPVYVFNPRDEDVIRGASVTTATVAPTGQGATALVCSETETVQTAFAGNEHTGEIASGDTMLEPMSTQQGTIDVSKQRITGDTSDACCKSCMAPSRYCVRSPGQCRLPCAVQGSAFHRTCHHAYVRVELVRPFPIGHQPACPGKLPCTDDMDLSALEDAMRTNIHASPSYHTAAHAEEAPFLERVRTALEMATDCQKLKHGDAMTLDDIIVCYYFRALQSGVFPHTCKLGHCRKSWSEPCKRNLPATETCFSMKQDDETERQCYVRRHLPDDAWMVPHILEILVATLDNVQTNAHHPNDAGRGQGYALKYQMKRAPQLALAMRNEYGDPVVEYFKFQVVALAEAVASILGDSVVHASRHAPLVPMSFDQRSGLWAHYTQRFVNYDLDNNKVEQRASLGADVCEADCRQSLCMARCTQFLRYFNRRCDDSGVGGHNDASAGGVKAGCCKRARTVVQCMNAMTCDCRHDDEQHPDFEIVFSHLVPGERVHFKHYDTPICYRRVRNGDLLFPRHIWHEVSLKKDAQGRAERSKHYETRLLANLNWHLTPDGLVTVVPLYALQAPTPQFQFWELTTMGPSASDGDGTAYVKPKAHLGPEKDARRTEKDVPEETPTGQDFEAWCMELENFFSAANTCCSCCTQTPDKRCTLCFAAVGWHRCKKVKEHWSSWQSFRWCPGSLWRRKTEDAAVMIIERISEGTNPQAILEQLERYSADNIIGTGTAEQLRRYIQDTCQIPVDTGILPMAPHQRTILAHEMLSSTPAMRAALEASLQEFMAKLQSVWCSAAHKYVPWYTADLVKPPSQYLAFQQLQYRWENAVPIAVCLVAPAGFGKSELLAAWRSYTTLQGATWAAVAPTGVAASQVGGGALLPPPTNKKMEKKKIEGTKNTRKSEVNLFV